MKASKVVQIQMPLQRSRLIKQLKTAVLLVGLLLLAACGGQANDEPEAVVSGDPVTADGEAVFKKNCAACHAVSAETIIVGPSLAGIASRAETRVEGLSTAEYIQFSILRPGDYVVDGFSELMPTNFGTTLSGEELDALVAYLMTLE